MLRAKRNSKPRAHALGLAALPKLALNATVEPRTNRASRGRKSGVCHFSADLELARNPGLTSGAGPASPRGVLRVV
jgi:hypothetical protein